MLNWRRFYLNVVATTGGVVVVIAILFALRSGASLPTLTTTAHSLPATVVVPSPVPLLSSSNPAVSEDTVALVNGDRISRAEWQKVTALDRVMSQLAGQPQPDAEAVLDRLINERLILRLAGDKVSADDLLARERLALLQQNWHADDAAMDQALASAGLVRQDLLAETKRLLVVEAFLKQIAATQDAMAWLAAQRSHSQVGVYADLAASIPTPVDQATVPSPVSTQTPAQITATGSAPGQVGPDFMLEDLGGQRIKLSDWRGHPVVVSFWATWCPVCRQELPALESAYQRYRDRGVVLAGVDVRENAELVRGLAAQFGLTYRLLLDRDGSVSDRYQVRGIPTTVFLDAEGVVRARHVGPLTEDKLAEYLTPLLASAELAPSMVAPLAKSAPDFNLPRESGQIVHLNDYRDRSSVVLVFYRGQT